MVLFLPLISFSKTFLKSFKNPKLPDNSANLWLIKVSLLLLMGLFSGRAQSASLPGTELTAESPLVWQITGRVTTTGGDPLPGVAVVVKGTTTGVSTDVNGTFTIGVPETPGTLVFSFIGMETRELPFTGPGVINVTLSEDARSLEELGW